MAVNVCASLPKVQVMLSSISATLMVSLLFVSSESPPFMVSPGSFSISLSGKAALVNTKLSSSPRPLSWVNPGVVPMLKVSLPSEPLPISMPATVKLAVLTGGISLSPAVTTVVTVLAVKSQVLFKFVVFVKSNESMSSIISGVTLESRLVGASPPTKLISATAEVTLKVSAAVPPVIWLMPVNAVM